MNGNKVIRVTFGERIEQAKKKAEEEYQEKLEMDIRIQEVPREKRHIFYVYPNK